MFRNSWPGAVMIVVPIDKICPTGMWYYSIFYSKTMIVWPVQAVFTYHVGVVRDVGSAAIEDP